MVSLSWVTTGGFAILALLCVSVFFGMRRLRSLAWLTGTVVCATIQTAFLGEAHVVPMSSLVVTVLTPLAYLCFGQSIRAVLRQRHQNWGLYGFVGLLTVAGIVLKLMDVPFLARTPFFQLACALSLIDSVERLLRQRQRDITETLLLGVVFGVIAIFLFRAFTYPVMFPAGITYAELRAGPIERGTLIASALFSVPAVLLQMARIINSVIVSYRLRSECDGLTGLLNHQAFHRVGAKANGGGGSVIFCDIDHFKSINDRFGHLAGDKALRAFADLLRLSGYTAGRVGGEEFALILPGLSADVAVEEAETMRQRFGDLRHADMPADRRISASFGVAEFAAGEDPRSAFARADAALYAAKKAGRNRVMCAGLDEAA